MIKQPLSTIQNYFFDEENPRLLKIGLVKYKKGLSYRESDV